MRRAGARTFLRASSIAAASPAAKMPRTGPVGRSHPRDLLLWAPLLKGQGSAWPLGKNDPGGFFWAAWGNISAPGWAATHHPVQRAHFSCDWFSAGGGKERPVSKCKEGPWQMSGCESGSREERWAPPPLPVMVTPAHGSAAEAIQWEERAWDGVCRGGVGGRAGMTSVLWSVIGAYGLHRAQWPQGTWKVPGDRLVAPGRAQWVAGRARVALASEEQVWGPRIGPESCPWSENHQEGGHSSQMMG